MPNPWRLFGRPMPYSERRAKQPCPCSPCLLNALWFLPRSWLGPASPTYAGGNRQGQSASASLVAVGQSGPYRSTAGSAALSLLLPCHPSSHEHVPRRHHRCCLRCRFVKADPLLLRESLKLWSCAWAHLSKGAEMAQQQMPHQRRLAPTGLPGRSAGGRGFHPRDLASSLFLPRIGLRSGTPICR